MLVSDSKGRVCHISRALAEMLGRTPAQAMVNNMQHALGQLMLEPFSQLHRALGSSIPLTAPPPYSCRSGLSLLLQAVGPQGRPQPVPLRMSIKRRPGVEDTHHVMCFQEGTMKQVRVCVLFVLGWGCVRGFVKVVTGALVSSVG
jgi:hypothetical protein